MAAPAAWYAWHGVLGVFRKRGHQHAHPLLDVRVLYTQGANLNKPLRLAQDATKYPFEDQDVTGGGLNQDSITICYDVEWPAQFLWNSKRRIDRGKYGPPSWIGSPRPAFTLRSGRNGIQKAEKREWRDGRIHPPKLTSGNSR